MNNNGAKLTNFLEEIQQEIKILNHSDQMKLDNYFNKELYDVLLNQQEKKGNLAGINLADFGLSDFCPDEFLSKSSKKIKEKLDVASEQEKSSDHFYESDFEVKYKRY